MFPQINVPWDEAHLPLLLTLVRSRVKQVSLQFLAPHNLTPPQFQVLAVLESNPGICHKNLAGALGMDKPTATRILQTLQKKAWILIEPDPTHGRRLRIKLSPEGARVLGQIAEFRHTFREGLEEGMDPAERQQLRELLRRLMLNLDRLEQVSFSSK
ncbi:MarR family winged helix-turn-helix transcriptional regulator [Holophaga foetida]|uniref:MarR family winged helix-turn-helix transcriptional regulator n=1 Tax=Holophaga foetida TaxID=35839 RepID=UPI00024742CC|nr:MarR family transcriptional regulator [Holophaga foetida]